MIPHFSGRCLSSGRNGHVLMLLSYDIPFIPYSNLFHVIPLTILPLLVVGTDA